jgi:hypothetical protein
VAELRPELRDALAREDWCSWAERVVKMAEAQTKGLRWRGTKEGVLPDGCDARSIAHEAVAELFAGNCKLPFGYDRECLEAEFERLVHQQVNRLHQRKENWLVRNGPDLARLRTRDGEKLREEEAIPDENAGPDGTAIEIEREKRLVEFTRRATEYLRLDREALAVFGCLSDGVSRREEIAARLGMEPSQVKNARKRMDRLLKAFALNGGREICDDVRRD